MSYLCSICGKEINSGLRDSSGRIFCSEACYQKILPKCAICGRRMRQWTEDEQGKKYCSSACYEKSLPLCTVCGKPMHKWIETKDGKRYCSERCFERTLPKCAICGRPVNGGLKDRAGKIYCGESCYNQSLPMCAVCGKHMKQWIETEDGKKYCSEFCFHTTLPKCRICVKPVESGYRDEKNNYYCSESCYERSLPRCSVCGKPVRRGWRDIKGNYFCSKNCYETTLPRCLCCGKPMQEWIETDSHQRFCSQSCLEQFQIQKDEHPIVNMEKTLTAKELAYLIGLSEKECEDLMTVNHLDGDEALEAVDIFMEALNNNVAVPAEIAACMNKAGIYSQLASRLSAYNTMRGGVKGYGGFVFEELHAADAASKGVNIQVLANNGPADFIVVDANGQQTLVQAKAGYRPNQINWSKYKGQKVVVDKGNTALANDARAAGLVVEESSVYKLQADIIARAQQWESQLTGSATAPITANVASSYYAGLASAKFAARVGVSMHVGATIYDVLAGNKSFEEGVADCIVDGTITIGGAFVGGAALNLAGSAVTALAGTSAGTAVAGVVTGAGAAIGSTAVGGAMLAGATTVATGIGTAVAAVSAAPLVPVVMVGAAVGFVGKWLFD